MWIYIQATGGLFDPDGRHVTTGYSGAWDGSRPPGSSNPNDHRDRAIDEGKVKLGPIPRGKYTIGRAYHDTYENKGPYAMHLMPWPENEMFGRSGFMIHGDSVSHPGQASEGCIILDKTTRLLIDASVDRILVVR